MHDPGTTRVIVDAHAVLIDAGAQHALTLACGRSGYIQALKNPGLAVGITQALSIVAKALDAQSPVPAISRVPTKLHAGGIDTGIAG